MCPFNMTTRTNNTDREDIRTVQVVKTCFVVNLQQVSGGGENEFEQKFVIRQWFWYQNVAYDVRLPTVSIMLSLVCRGQNLTLSIAYYWPVSFGAGLRVLEYNYGKLVT